MVHSVFISGRHLSALLASPSNPLPPSLSSHSPHISPTAFQPSRLVRLQPADHALHLRVRVDLEALVLGHARQLHVLGVQLLLHDLLERLEHQHLGLGQRQRLVELVLQLGLGALGAGPDGLGVVAVEGAAGLGVVAAISVSTISIWLW